MGVFQNKIEDNNMSDVSKVAELVGQFATRDKAQRAAARENIRAMGRAALQPLMMVKFQQQGEAYTEVFKTFAAIGDDLFAAEGKEGLDKVIVDTMESGAKKTRQYAAEEVHALSVDALTRWGLEVPPVLEQKVHICHICGRESTEARVKVCALHACGSAVCKDHAHIISTRFGQFDGSGGAWFCTKEHFNHANRKHTDWN